MSKKQATVAKTTTKEQKAETPKEEVKEAVQEIKTPQVEEEPVEEKEEVVEAVNESEEDGKVWVKNWRDLVKVEGSKQDLYGKEYYGVKR